MSIAANLKREMARHDYTTSRLSELSGVSKANLGKYLAGTVKPAQDVVERLAAAIGCGAQDIMTEPKRKTTKGVNVSVEYAAGVLGIGTQTLRIMLQKQMEPFSRFGIAIPGRTGKYRYLINKRDFEEYTGITVNETG